MNENDRNNYLAIVKVALVYEEALTSIANSSCCGCCQEAKLVARKALDKAGSPVV